jgi:predicted HTH domain antitoxin
MESSIPQAIKKKFLAEILKLYTQGELSAGRAAEMMGISRAEFYELLNQRNLLLPKKLNESILKELNTLE